MIRTQEDFEAAVEQAAQYLECPPAHGTAEAAEFARLLHDIETYRPEPPPPEKIADPDQARIAELEHRLAQFRAKYNPDRPPGLTPAFGFGHDVRGREG
jgi:antitoxin component HigA of HigAB toxin-antitoxin module